MRSLSALDLAFFIAESEQSPKHVAGLMLFKKPARARADFGRNLVEKLKTHQELVEPFNLVIRFGGLKGPRWTACSTFDIEQHVFYHRIGRTCTWSQVKEFVSRLHEPVMDRSRPLWEYHLVDGVEGGRFAVYFKVHHAYADGMTMTAWLRKSLSESATDRSLNPLWTMPLSRKPEAGDHGFSISRGVLSASRMARDGILTAGGMAKLSAQQLLERAGVTHKSVSLNFDAAHDTPLTGSATPGREIATACLSMTDVKRVCKETRSTLNHVALSCIDGALHRYLAETGHAVNHPVTIQMPVNLRSEQKDASGNILGVALVELGSPDADPLKRLQEVGHSLHHVKQQIEAGRSDSMQQYTVMLALAGEFIEKVRLSDRVPTNGHTLVSNVPGPTDPLYLNGAKLEQIYPISILVPGLRSNITLFSYGDTLNIGVVATRDLENLDAFTRLIEEEFAALEEALGEA